MHLRSCREFFNLIMLVCIVHSAEQSYDYELKGEGQALQGYVYTDVTSGEKIRASSEGKSSSEAGNHVVKYLQLLVKKKGSEHPLIELENTTALFVGLTDAVYVDEEKYLIINDTEVFDEQSEIIFYVVLINSSTGNSISNPLPFFVRAEKKEISEQHFSNEAAIFAGVLILVIVFLALFIPFVVRAKRRMRAGKPVMKLGSHAGSEVSLERKQSSEFLDLSKRSESVPNFYGDNTNFDYGNEVRKERDHFTKDIKHLDDDYRVHERAKFSFGEETDGGSSGAKRPMKGILRNPKSQSDEEVSKL